jgi:hypothetical protein
MLLAGAALIVNAIQLTRSRRLFLATRSQVAWSRFQRAIVSILMLGCGVASVVLALRSVRDLSETILFTIIFVAGLFLVIDPKLVLGWLLRYYPHLAAGEHLALIVVRIIGVVALIMAGAIAFTATR